MNNLITTVAAYFLCLGCLFGQLQIERQVIASAGGVGFSDSLSISATLGEVAILTLAPGSNQLTQGFQQTENIISSTIDLGVGVGAKLFPNPAREFTILSIETETNLDLQIDLVNISGKLIHSNKQQLHNGVFIHTIHLDKLPAGTYFVKIASSIAKAPKTLKLVHF